MIPYCKITPKRILKSDRSPLSKKQVGELEALENDLVVALKEVTEENIDGADIENVAGILFKKIVKMLPIKKDKTREAAVKMFTRASVDSVVTRVRAQLKNEALLVADPEPIKYPFTVSDEENLPRLYIAGNVPSEILEKFKHRELQANKTRVRNGHAKWKKIDEAVG
jgi:hypothetical protein